MANNKEIPKRKRGRPPKFDKILAALRADILSGKFQPHDRLPTRERLATMFGSTKVTIQKAMDVLLEEGILTARRGAGTYVTGAAESRLPYYLVVPTKPGESRFKDALVREAKKRSTETHSLVVCNCSKPNETSEDITRLQNLIARHRVAGMMIASSYSVLQGSSFLNSPGVPKVYIGKDCDPSEPVVGYEGRDVIYSKVLDYFKEHGCRSAGIIMPSAHKYFLEESPFRQLAEARGIEVPLEWEQASTPLANNTASRIIRLMFSNPANRPEALHIGDDMLVPDVTKTLSELGLNVPEDLIVTGHANFPYPTTSHISLRRIGYDVRECIRLSLETLDLIRKGVKPPKTDFSVVWEDEIQDLK